MALCRQGSGGLQDWSNSFGPTLRSHDHGNMRQQGDSGNGLYRAQPKSNRVRKLGRAAKSQECSIGVIVVVFFGLVGLTLLGNHYREKGGQESSEREELFDNQNSKGQDYTWAETNHNIRRDGRDEILHQRDARKESHTLVHRSSSWASKVLGFGQGSSGSGQDSRYWDRDDRRRDEEYDKNVGSAFKLQKNGLDDEEDISENGFNSRRESGANKDDMDKIKEATYFEDLKKQNRSTVNPNGQDFGKESLYNEHGRDELKVYEARYEADLQEELSLNKTAKGDALSNTDLGANIRGGIGENSSSNSGNNKNLSQILNYKRNAIEDEYDDGIDDDDAHAEDNISEISHQHHHASRMKKDHDKNNLIETQKHQAKSFDDEQKELSEKVFRENFDRKAALLNDSAQDYDHNNFSEVQSNFSTADSNNGKLNETLDSKFEKESALFISGFDEKWSQNVLRSEKLANASDIASWKVDTLKRNTNSSRSKRRRRPSPPCEIAFLNSSDGLQEPEENPKFAKFSLEFIQREEKPGGVDVWEPRFAGHQSLGQRENTFYARDQKVHCGFVKGPEGSRSTGFDLDEEDTEFLSTCHIAVSSCIFGNSDNIRIPTKKKLSQNSKKNVCFVMFVDEKTLETMSLEGRQLDANGYIGLWKIVVVRNLPYTDMRRTGKVPKFLAHRLFPSARYSIWLDSKMRLDSDPLLILEYFLWRGGFEYAIANHYDRHCVWEEVMQNKRLNKFNHTVIDEQFASYQADGLIKFNETDPNKLLPSYVPEGSFIVRAHTPMSNLFSCLWFNEVDRFTPRDQLSFAYTFLKLRRRNPETHFWLNMFKDCERRFMAKLFHHRTEGTPPSSGSSKK